MNQAGSAPSDLAALNNSSSDAALLEQFVSGHRPEAFTELVRRHLGLVYRAALRQVGDADLAEDVAQTVFTDLARKAASLRGRETLSGWLHTSTRYAALKARRSQQRRQVREQETYAMHSAPSDSIEWNRLRPVIDDALHTLAQSDRDVVLLRFFGGRSYSEIGSQIGLPEDTVRVRVNRALEKLARTLRKRGVVSTAAALAVALGAEPTASIPIRLAAQLSSGALAGAVVGAGTIVATTWLAILATAGAVTAGGIAVHQTRERSRLEAELADAIRGRAQLAERLRSTGEKLSRATHQAAAEAADTASLLTAISRMNAPSNDAKANAKAPSEDEVKARFARAQKLDREGHWEEALPEYVWCFDEGMVRIQSYSGVRRSFLTSALGRLAQKFPDARVAIEARIAQAEQSMSASKNNFDAASDYAALNHALDQDDRTLAYYERLSADDPRRTVLGGGYLYDSFVSSKRYEDAVQSRPYERTLQTFTLMSGQLATGAIPAAALPGMRSKMIEDAAKSVEALAGAGDLAHAREFAAKVLALDPSPTTQSLLQTHAARAGHPEVAPQSAP